MEWLICFSIVNLMLGCVLSKKSKKLNEFCSLSKGGRMSHILKLKFRFDSSQWFSFGPYHSYDFHGFLRIKVAKSI